MTSTVIDASAVLAWLLPSQATPAAGEFLSRSSGGFIAPAMFEWEVKNVLLSRAQRSRMTIADLSAALDQLDAYDVEIADPVDPNGLLQLALDERLSLFDAAYLALALQTSSGLASKDEALIDAARGRELLVHDLGAAA